MRIISAWLFLSFLMVQCPTHSSPVAPPTQHNLSVSVDPKDAGSVDPSGGTYDDEKQVSISASPNSGYRFSNWTGDVNSDQNPVTVTMDDDKNIVAHFKETPKSFNENIRIADGKNSFVLTIGTDSSATAGFDRGIDKLAPPPPPSGAFYAQFVIPDHNLIKDFRPVTSNETVWTLEFSPQSGKTATISWDLSDTPVGGLVLTDDPDTPSFTVNMARASEYTVSNTSIRRLYIINKP